MGDGEQGFMTCSGSKVDFRWISRISRNNDRYTDRLLDRLRDAKVSKDMLVLAFLWPSFFSFLLSLRKVPRWLEQDFSVECSIFSWPRWIVIIIMLNFCRGVKKTGIVFTTIWFLRLTEILLLLEILVVGEEKKKELWKVLIRDRMKWIWNDWLMYCWHFSDCHSLKKSRVGKFAKEIFIVYYNASVHLTVKTSNRSKRLRYPIQVWSFQFAWFSSCSCSLLGI